MLDLRKLLLSCSLVLALLMVGCGKKNDSKKNKEMAFGDTESSYTLAESIIDDNEIENFFDDEDAIEEFAFADDFEDEDLIDFDQEELDDSLFVENELEEDSFVAWDEEEIKELNFKTVQFDINKNGIKDDQEDFLKENIQTAKIAIEEGKTVVVQGHACQLGSPSFNMPLSQRRADAIKLEMVKNGLPEDKIKTIGYGQEVPLVWTDTTDKQELVKELAPNRRVEITVG